MPLEPCVSLPPTRAHLHNPNSDDESCTARQQFGALQHKTFPVYFVQSIVLSGSLLAIWVQKHPHIVQNAFKPWYLDVAQAYALAIVLIGQGLNYFVVGPMTSKCVLSSRFGGMDVC